MQLLAELLAGINTALRQLPKRRIGGQLSARRLPQNTLPSCIEQNDTGAADSSVLRRMVGGKIGNRIRHIHLASRCRKHATGCFLQADKQLNGFLQLRIVFRSGGMKATAFLRCSSSRSRPLRTPHWRTHQYLCRPVRRANQLRGGLYDLSNPPAIAVRQ